MKRALTIAAAFLLTAKLCLGNVSGTESGTGGSSAGALLTNGTVAMGATLNMGANTISNLSGAVNALDAVNLTQLQGATNGLSGGGALNTNVFTIIPTNFVWGQTSGIDTNSGLLFTTNNNQAYISFQTNFTGPILISGVNAETNFAVINIPANSIGLNGIVYISGLWERRTGSPSGVACRIRMGTGTATGSQLVHALSAGASNASLHLARELFSANSSTNLVGVGTAANFGTAGSTPPAFMTDSTVNVIPVYFNALPNITTETNILWGAHIRVTHQN